MACHCGHAIEEHGHDPRHPGSTACSIEGCDCIAFEEADDEDELAKSIGLGDARLHDHQPHGEKR